MFNPLPGFGAGSGSNQAPVGCLGALIALFIMLAAFAVFFTLLLHAFRQFG